MCSHTDTHKSRALQVEDGYAFHTWGGCASKPVTASHIRFIPTRVGQIAIARPAPFRQRAACLEPVHFFSIPQRTHNVKPVNNKDRVKQFREKSDRRQRICGCDR